MTLDETGGLAVALGIGLLVGIERERRKGTGPNRGAAGLRTFALVGLGGGLGALVGTPGVVIAGLFTALAALLSYRGREPGRDPGLTTAFAMVVVFLLGVLAMKELMLASAAGVAVAVLLATKTRAHHFVREVLTGEEIDDALLLVAAAVIVLPLLPDRAVDPWGVLNPRELWLLGLIVMAINAFGHVALRLLGARLGLLVAGLASGFASSTATVGAMGMLARRSPEYATPAATAALLSNVSTVVQLAVVTGVIEPALLAAIAWPLAASGGAIVLFAAAAVWRGRGMRAPEAAAGIGGRAFQPRHALVFVAVVAGVLLVSAATLAWFGNTAVTTALAISGFADAHAPAVSAARLVGTGQIPLHTGALAVALGLAANSASKTVLAAASGGAAYTWRLLPGLIAMVGAFSIALALGRA